MNNNQNMQQNGFNTNPYINQNQNAGLNQPNNPYINPNQQMPQNQQPQQGQGFNNGDFLKGALIGASVTFLLTNKTTQEAIFGGLSKGNELIQAGIEELKERVEDAKAQMEAKEY